MITYVVVGIRDTALSEKLQVDANLDLEKAITTACQTETVKKQQSTVRGMATAGDLTIDTLVTKRCPLKGQGSHNHRQTNSKIPRTALHTGKRTSVNKNTCW